jgi:thymidylate synthase (FAD)
MNQNCSLTFNRKVKIGMKNKENYMLTTAKLVSYSMPTEAFEQEGLKNVQDLISYCARVSNPANQFNNKTSTKLIQYLIKHKHWSPLEMASACLEIETTRDIAHQLVRHRSFSFQEFSQRYADPQSMGDAFTLRECRLQDPENRQNSIEIENDPSLQLDLHRQELITEWQRRQHGVINQSKELYNWAIEHGIAKEQARAVLPEGLTKTRVMMNGTLRSWVHYIELRGANGTQKEHMEIAQAAAKEIAQIFPLMEKL